ncbi:MAG: Sll0314/Alr1548 family TPR repeat-containing protein [Cyanobacteria bacterium J06623_7]
MTFKPMTFKPKFIGSKNRLKRGLLVIPLAASMLLSLSNFAAWGKDPFRDKNARDIGKHTEKAFETIFLEGNYKAVTEDLSKAEAEEPNEPLAYAMLASLAYTEKDWETIKQYADKTLESALTLSEADPVRGNLYLGVGHFLDGAYIYEKEGALPAINKLQQVFKYLERAEDADPNDPELNLIKGYMELLLAVNLPFSSPERAIARFEDRAAPNYLVERGLAVAYRDLKDYDNALKYANKAISTAPENPEHYYLKGQILRKLGKQKQSVKILNEAIANFELALAKSEQLPEFVLETLEREHRKAQEKVVEIESARQN